jgi:CxxC-x17-CxxC domain-containing protein
MFTSQRRASMSYVDKTLTCEDCGTTFVFSAGEQEFFAQKGFQNEPRRCHDCRRTRRNRMSALSSGPRQMYPVICAQCGVETEVPFQPTGIKPVYCRACFDALRLSGQA